MLASYERYAQRHVQVGAALQWAMQNYQLPWDLDYYWQLATLEAALGNVRATLFGDIPPAQDSQQGQRASLELSTEGEALWALWQLPQHMRDPRLDTALRKVVVRRSQMRLYRDVQQQQQRHQRQQQQYIHVDDVVRAQFITYCCIQMGTHVHYLDANQYATLLLTYHKEFGRGDQTGGEYLLDSSLFASVSKVKEDARQPRVYRRRRDNPGARVVPPPSRNVGTSDSSHTDADDDRVPGNPQDVDAGHSASSGSAAASASAEDTRSEAHSEPDEESSSADIHQADSVQGEVALSEVGSEDAECESVDGYSFYGAKTCTGTMLSSGGGAPELDREKDLEGIAEVTPVGKVLILLELKHRHGVAYFDQTKRWHSTHYVDVEDSQNNWSYRLHYRLTDILRMLQSSKNVVVGITFCSYSDRNSASVMLSAMLEDLFGDGWVQQEKQRQRSFSHREHGTVYFWTNTDMITEERDNDDEHRYSKLLHRIFEMLRCATGDCFEERSTICLDVVKANFSHQESVIVLPEWKAWRTGQDDGEDGCELCLQDCLKTVLDEIDSESLIDVRDHVKAYEDACSRRAQAEGPPDRWSAADRWPADRWSAAADPWPAAADRWSDVPAGWLDA
eukprot:TRINITY_DN3710_c0_g1_i1.p1 TRINITY_DN3710_c0_g1~~TRINITY_DN3710_c0_g1_i1.p1  ORF type:complete len:620 (+),score=124.46 TRINITY_DN3710_c0_g1_i1:89-1948(+)